MADRTVSSASQQQQYLEGQAALSLLKSFTRASQENRLITDKFTSGAPVAEDVLRINELSRLLLEETESVRKQQSRSYMLLNSADHVDAFIKQVQATAHSYAARQSSSSRLDPSRLSALSSAHPASGPLTPSRLPTPPLPLPLTDPSVVAITPSLSQHPDRSVPSSAHPHLQRLAPPPLSRLPSLSLHDDTPPPVRQHDPVAPASSLVLDSRVQPVLSPFSPLPNDSARARPLGPKSLTAPTLSRDSRVAVQQQDLHSNPLLSTDATRAQTPQQHGLVAPASSSVLDSRLQQSAHSLFLPPPSRDDDQRLPVDSRLAAANTPLAPLFSSDDDLEPPVLQLSQMFPPGMMQQQRTASSQDRPSPLAPIPSASASSVLRPSVQQLSLLTDIVVKRTSPEDEAIMLSKLTNKIVEKNLNEVEGSDLEARLRAAVAAAAHEDVTALIINPYTFASGMTAEKIGETCKKVLTPDLATGGLIYIVIAIPKTKLDKDFRDIARQLVTQSKVSVYGQNDQLLTEQNLAPVSSQSSVRSSRTLAPSLQPRSRSVASRPAPSRDQHRVDSDDDLEPAPVRTSTVKAENKDTGRRSPTHHHVHFDDRDDDVRGIQQQRRVSPTATTTHRPSRQQPPAYQPSLHHSQHAPAAASTKGSSNKPVKSPIRSWKDFK